MGLDVYLRKFPDYEAYKQRSQEYEERSEAAWNQFGDRKYEDLTDAEKDAIRDENKALAASMGLGEWGDDPTVEKIELDSPTYPDHMFKIGYWRSSYNSGGVNHVLQDAIGKDLYYIAFGGREEEPAEYEMAIDYAAAKDRCVEVRQLFGTYVRDYGVRVMDIQCNLFTPPSDLPVGASAAVDIYRKEVDRRKENPRQQFDPDSEYDWYSNSQGEFFFGKPLEVIAAVAGIGTFGKETVFLLYKGGDMGWFEQALEIVEETLDYVLAQPDPDKYRLAWSG